MSKPILTLPCKYTISDFEKKGELHHCKACDHSLKDFRGSTTDDIRQATKESGNKTCGIFHASQLTHQTTTYQLGIQRSIGLSLLGILGFISPAVLTSCSKAPDATFPEEKSQQDKEAEAFAKLKFPMMVSGHLKDRLNGEPLAMSEISICQKKTFIRTVHTDANGFFQIRLEKGDLTSANFELVLERLNYKTDTIHEIANLPKEDRSHLVLSLEAYPKPVDPNDDCYQMSIAGNFISEVRYGSIATGFTPLLFSSNPPSSDLTRLVQRSGGETINNPNPKKQD